MSTRNRQRLQERISRKIALLLQQEIKDPRLKQATITGIEIIPNGALAKVYFCCYLAGETPASLTRTLNKAAGFLGRRLASTLKTRRTPQLLFVYDKSFDHAQVIETLLQNPSS